MIDLLEQMKLFIEAINSNNPSEKITKDHIEDIKKKIARNNVNDHPTTSAKSTANAKVLQPKKKPPAAANPPVPNEANELGNTQNNEINVPISPNDQAPKQEDSNLPSLAAAQPQSQSLPDQTSSAINGSQQNDPNSLPSTGPETNPNPTLPNPEDLLKSKNQNNDSQATSQGAPSQGNNSPEMTTELIKRLRTPRSRRRKNKPIETHSDSEVTGKLRRHRPDLPHQT